jgi:hypothetical protein
MAVLIGFAMAMLALTRAQPAIAPLLVGMSPALLQRQLRSVAPLA